MIRSGYYVEPRQATCVTKQVSVTDKAGERYRQSRSALQRKHWHHWGVRDTTGGCYGHNRWVLQTKQVGVTGKAGGRSRQLVFSEFSQKFPPRKHFGSFRADFRNFEFGRCLSLSEIFMHHDGAPAGGAPGHVERCKN